MYHGVLHGPFPPRWLWYACAALPRLALWLGAVRIVAAREGFSPSFLLPGAHRQAFVAAAAWAAWAGGLRVPGVEGSSSNSSSSSVSPFPSALLAGLCRVAASAGLVGGGKGPLGGAEGGGAAAAAAAAAAAPAALPTTPWREIIPPHALAHEMAWAAPELALSPPPQCLVQCALEALAQRGAV